MNVSAVVVRVRIREGCPDCDSSLCDMSAVLELGQSVLVDLASREVRPVMQHMEHPRIIGIDMVQSLDGRWIPSECLSVQGRPL